MFFHNLCHNLFRSAGADETCTPSPMYATAATIPQSIPLHGDNSYIFADGPRRRMYTAVEMLTTRTPSRRRNMCSLPCGV